MEAWRLKLRQRILGESVIPNDTKLGPTSLYQWKKTAPKVTEAKSIPQQAVEQVKLEEKIEKIVAQSEPKNKYAVL